MKKIISNADYKKKQKIKEKRAEYTRNRVSKPYTNKYIDLNIDIPEYIRSRSLQKNNIKRISPPNNFSFIDNSDKSLEFFNDFFVAIENGYTKFHFDMTNIEDLGIETLLYIISLDKIYNAKGKKIQIKLSIPKKDDLRYKMYVSGFAKYFTKNLNFKDIDTKNIFPICDGATNKFNEKDDGATCAEAVDFAKTFASKDKHKDILFRMLYNSLAELMLNTDNHAYGEVETETKSETKNNINPSDILRNWYLFAVKLEKGVAFYFFDNGEGITKTARKKIIDKAYGLIGLEQKNILESVLNGEFRSKTGLPYRGRGLPQINELLTNNDIILSVILTNKVLCLYDETTKNVVFKKVKFDFKGSLFVWVLPYDN